MTVKGTGELVMLGGVATAFTVTLTFPLIVLYLVESVGVNVTDCVFVPTLGTEDGEVKANVPATDAEPPLNAEDASDCPDVITDAVGRVVITGVALLTVKLAFPLVTLPAELLTTTL